MRSDLPANLWRWSDISSGQPSVNAICTVCADGEERLPSNQLHDLLPLVSAPPFTANKAAGLKPLCIEISFYTYTIFQMIPNALLVFVNCFVKLPLVGPHSLKLSIQPIWAHILTTTMWHYHRWHGGTALVCSSVIFYMPVRHDLIRIFSWQNNLKSKSVHKLFFLCEPNSAQFLWRRLSCQHVIQAVS